MRLSQTEALVLRGREGTLTGSFPLPHATLSQDKTVPDPPTCPVFAEVPPLPVTSTGAVTCRPKPRPRADIMAPPLALSPCSKAYPPPSDRRATASCGGGRSCSCGRRGCRGDGESPGPLETVSGGAPREQGWARAALGGEGDDLGPLSPQPPPAASARCMSGTVVSPTRGARLRRTD